MTDLEIRVDPKTGLRVGPVATRLLLENDDVKIWKVETGAGETFWHHYHHLDYVLFQITDIFGAVYNAPEDHQRIWQSRSASGEVIPDATLGTLLPAHGVNYIPGTGFLSPGYVNIGAGTFHAALIEIQRTRRPDQAGIGYARSDALAGMDPRAGRVLLLENDRVRVHETTLEPGQADEAGPRLDAAVFVIEAGRVAVSQSASLEVVAAADGPRPASVQERETDTGWWLTASPRRQIENRGTTRYRELSIELK